MDKNLSWKYHISELTKKLSRTCGIFFKIRHFLHLDDLKSLYYSIFSSFLCYGSTTLGPSYDTYLEPLFLMQKKVLRSISLQPFASPSTPIFASLKILKLKGMIYQDILKFVFKSINLLSPSHLHNYFQLSNMVHNHGTRHAIRGDIFQPSRNTFLYGLRSIKYLGVKLWNDIQYHFFKSFSISFYQYFQIKTEGIPHKWLFSLIIDCDFFLSSLLSKLVRLFQYLHRETWVGWW